MSTQPVIPPARLPIGKRVHLVKAKPAKKRPAPFCVTRKPLPATADAMRYSASTTLKENFNYLQAVALYRWELIQAALAAAKGVKKHAAAQLGISRAALNAYLKRGGDVL